jgi:hypothetical protein
MTSTGSLPTLERMQRAVLQASSLAVGLLLLNACKVAAAEIPSGMSENAGTASQAEDHRMLMTVGRRTFEITLGNTEAARAFAAQLPLTLDMAELNGNEKHADLSQALPTEANRPGTIQSGDLLLYGSRTLVVFYKTFRSSYSYTRIGHVDDPTGLEQALGQGDMRIVFSSD